MRSIRSVLLELFVYSIVIAIIAGLTMGVLANSRSGSNSANSGAIHLDATPTKQFILEPESVLINRIDRVEIIVL